MSIDRLPDSAGAPSALKPNGQQKPTERDNALADCKSDGVSSALCSKLAVDDLEVGGDGRRAEAKSLSYFFVRLTLQQKGQTDQLLS